MILALLITLIITSVKQGLATLDLTILLTTLLTIALITIAAYTTIVLLPRRNSVLLGFSRLLPVWIKLRGSEGARHIIVLGVTGSGKTETIKRLISRSKVLVFDWAGEYTTISPVVKPEELSLRGLTTEEMVEAVSNAFQLTVPQSGFLYNVLKNVEVKDLKVVVERLRSLPESNLSAPEREIRAALLRRLAPCEGLFAGSTSLASAARVNLAHLTYDGKVLTLNVALRVVYNIARRGQLRDKVLVIEEAQNVIPKRGEGPPTSGELLLQEMRKYGVSVVLSAQLPSTLSEYFRDAEYVVMHRLLINSEELRDFSVVLDEEDFQRLAKAPTGTALIIHRGGKRWVKVLRTRKPKTQGATVMPPPTAENGQAKNIEGLKKDFAELANRVEELRNDIRILFQANVDVYGGIEKLEGRLKSLEAFKENLEKIVRERGEKALQHNQRYSELTKRVDVLEEELVKGVGSVLEGLEGRMEKVEENLKLTMSALSDAFKKIHAIEGSIKRLESVECELFNVSECLAKVSKQVEQLSTCINELKEGL